MGSSQARVDYAHYRGKAERRQSGILRNSDLKNDQELPASHDIQVNNLAQALQKFVKLQPQRPYFGTRKVLDNKQRGMYEWKSFKQVYMRVVTLSRAIVELDLSPPTDKYEDKDLCFMGFYSKNREEYVMLDFACQYSCVTTVSLYDTLGAESTAFIINQTQLQTIACQGGLIQKLLMLKKNHNMGCLKNIISFDKVPDVPQGNLGSNKSLYQEAKELGVRIMHFNEVLMAGEGLQSEMKQRVSGPDNVVTICYTSGTTGNPKGVMLTNANFNSILSGTLNRGIKLAPGDFHLSYLPLAHIFEKFMIIGSAYIGYSVGFYQGDITKILDDIKTLRPSVFCSVPRLYNRIYDSIKKKFDDQKGCKKMLLNQALKSKISKAKKSGSFTHGFWDCLIFRKSKALLGGRVKFMVSGGAPLSSQVKSLLRVAFCCPVIEAYGQTQCTGGSCVEALNDPNLGTVGGPLTCNDIKVVQVGDLDYFPDDVVDGVPKPRGEVCIKGWNVFKGYYKNEQATRQAVDQDGWLHTGDIGMIHPNGAISIIDRKKHIFKLQQGEYIAPEKLENIYVSSKYVQQIFVHGDSLKTSIVAIIVIDPEALKAWGKKQGYDESVDQMINREDFIQTVNQDLQTIATLNKLSGLEKLKKIHYTLDPFSPEDDTLTPTYKFKRAKAKDKWKSQIEKLYVD